jgi:hypothetical protein
MGESLSDIGNPVFESTELGLFHASGIAVLTLSGSLISAITGFHKSVLPPFGLPRVLPHSTKSRH